MTITYVRGFYLGLLTGSSTPSLLCCLLLFRRDCPLLVAHVRSAFPTLRNKYEDKNKINTGGPWARNEASSSNTKAGNMEYQSH